MDSQLNDYRKIWESKSVLRAVYRDYYSRITNYCNDGLTLEIGGGSGNLKDSLNEVISVDILYAEWLDVIADAQLLPFKSDTFQNIILFDVLHHIQYPKQFLSEASRVLLPGGKIIILEPAITPVSWFFYNFIHHEPVLLKCNPLIDGEIDPNRDPYMSNQAIPSLLFGKYQSEFNKYFPELIISHKELLSLLAYPLSGGFKKWSLITKSLVKPLLNLENLLAPLLGHIMGFRLFIVLQKS